MAKNYSEYDPVADANIKSGLLVPVWDPESIGSEVRYMDYSQITTKLGVLYEPIQTPGSEVAKVAGASITKIIGATDTRTITLPNSSPNILQQTYSVTGLLTTDHVVVTETGTASAVVWINHYIVSAANTLQIWWTGVGANSVSRSVNIAVFRFA